MKRLTALSLVATIGMATLAGCSAPAASTAPASATSSVPTATPAAKGTVTVYAAASLTKTFTALGAELEKENPGLTVKFVFAGSSDLVSQLSAGAPGDVFASADQATMDKAVKAGLVAGDPQVFARNNLTIVTAPGNPKKIASLADLAKADVKLALCAPQVPCGAASSKVADLAGVTLSPVSEENAVTGVLAKVTAGEADAGLVYLTDAKGAGAKVTQVDFPESAKVTNVYPIAVLKWSTNPEAAAFVRSQITGASGQKILSEAGFAPGH